MDRLLTVKYEYDPHAITNRDDEAMSIAEHHSGNLVNSTHTGKWRDLEFVFPTEATWTAAKEEFESCDFETAEREPCA